MGILLVLMYFTNIGPLAVNIEAPNKTIKNKAIVEHVDKSVIKLVGGDCSGNGLVAQGTGWIIAKNTIMTNAHVVAGSTKIHAQGIKKPGEVIFYDEKNDVALIKINTGGKEALPIGHQTIGDNDYAIVIGYPSYGNRKVPVRLGSVRKQLTKTPRNKLVFKDVLFVKGDLKPGISGGPVVDESGQVIGMISALNFSLGIAVPSEIITEIREKVVERNPVDTGKC